jgi:osmotically-inducible protein OsmY
LRNDLQSLLQRSSALRDAGNIQLVVSDSRVILRGRVRTPRDRRLAEALIRMTPGVQDVQNNLQVTSPTVQRRLPGF